jgi:hypothetical protein
MKRTALSFPEAAKLSGLPRGTFHYHLRTGHIKAQRLNGRYWMIDPAAVYQFMMERALGQWIKKGRKRKNRA